MNGLKEGTEECDDGNSFNGDGCDNTCQLEDPSQSTWLCTTVENQLSVCCAALTSPASGNKTCSCLGETSAIVGSYITPSCELLDTDECATPNGYCHPNAVCENLDSRLGQGSHNCHCPPGMVGDGITTCDTYTYTTVFEVAIDGVAPSAFNISGFISDLFAWNVIPSEVTINGNQVRVLFPHTPVRR